MSEHTTIFICAQCGRTKTHTSFVTTGYGVDKRNRKICFACCGRNEMQQLKNLPIGKRTSLYLTLDSATNQYYVGNWPGTFKRTVSVRKGRHNMAGTRYDTWFDLRNRKGELLHYHGVQYGEFTQICHITRTKQ